MGIKGKSIMVLGTSSTVGKSITCTALCRIFTQDGYNVNPFKSQNMSLNSYITPEGHEMGRAQVMQAEAARKLPDVCMNPILIKPTSDSVSQIIVNGKVHGTMHFEEYLKYKPVLKSNIEELYNALKLKSDIVVLEGAGSPAEINLNENDMVNMGMAKIAKAPVILVGDIDKGGVFAALAGTMLLMSEEEKSMVKGVIINKFRGSYKLLEPGLKMLEDIIKVPVLGVVPYFNLNLEDEDSVTDWGKFSEGSERELDIAVIKVPFMSNFTDFNALRLYEDVNLRFVSDVKKLGKPDVIILPGSKSTIQDMKFLLHYGFKDKIEKCCAEGSFVFGICGGYQMLGISISDESEVETSAKFTEGLGLLKAVTEFEEQKTTTQCSGFDSLFYKPIKGYEIHMGVTKSVGDPSPTAFSKITANNTGEQKADGLIENDGRVIGTYMHGIFDNAQFTRCYLNLVRKAKRLEPVEETIPDYEDFKDLEYDKLADIVRKNLNMNKIYEILEEGL